MLLVRVSIGFSNVLDLCATFIGLSNVLNSLCVTLIRFSNAFGSLYDAFIGIFNRDRAVLGLCAAARLVLRIGAPSYLTAARGPWMT